jgi:hypothetical protein
MSGQTPERQASMLRYPAVVVHGLSDAREALGPGRAVTLLSAPGAALYAGCGWWRALLGNVRVEFPAVPVDDVLDCADASGQALAAMRIGQHIIVLAPAAPGWQAVAAIARESGTVLLTARPAALDLATRGASRRLPAWLGVA